MAHVRHLDGAEQGILEYGVAGGAVDRVDRAGDVGGDDISSSPARDLIFSCWRRISSWMLESSTPAVAAERASFSWAV